MFGIKDFNIEDIRALADVLNDKKLDKIEIKNAELSVTVEAHKAPAMMPPMMHMGMPAGVSAQAAAVQAETSAPVISGNVVKSPVVGTYYGSPAPDKAPFVTVGQKVFKGDILMIIESMKLMNEIQSEFTGTVEQILVENGQAVEFDQPLIIIK